MPLGGIICNVVAKFKQIWNANNDVAPVIAYNTNLSRAFSAADIKCFITLTNNYNNKQPTNAPNSSTNAANTKSFSAIGNLSIAKASSPIPNNPPWRIAFTA